MMPTSQTPGILDEAVERLYGTVGRFQSAASAELGLPVTHVADQIEFAAQALQCISEPRDPRPAPIRVAFLFPGNTEGALPAYLIGVALSKGLSVAAKLSRRQEAIAAALEWVFAPYPQVRFYRESGPVFLNRVLGDPAIRFLQVFGDDHWIESYRRKAAGRDLTLAFEGPGKDPFVVLPGADIESSADWAVESGLFAGGAACMSAERFIVHERIAEAFISEIVGRLAAISPTNPTDPASRLGWHASEAAVSRIEMQLAQARHLGARTRLDGRITRIDSGSRTFFACEPTVLSDVDPNALLWREETFGPVFPVLTFRTEDEAGDLAEHSDYGLSASVVGDPGAAERLSRRLKRSHAVVFTNTSMTAAFAPDFWGSGGYRRSGWIEETGPEGRRRRVGYRPLSDELDRIAATSSEVCR